ncbi:hypothetical protein BFP70_05855 [Thioclava sp. SK-1]|uniref:LysR family transcriptional regulator n=1 Tax=Thioclava sp. SK-1 TaxID=1889770 RepID=UPI000824FED9|nr:LysR family transcriptional regulator [Thioclava sp. SK-1]OCX66226.1 hypothetical protein BFP70_05855 [Thioclava sp. SK-1]
MDRIPRTTLEQWAVLKCVVDSGSFADAAHMLSRSQSSVSYAISRLQDSLGVTIMEMQGRRAVLTDTGRGLLSEVVPLIGDLISVETRAAELSRVAAPQLRIYVDSMFPRSWLLSALDRLIATYPNAQVDIHETERSGPPEPGSYDLAICLPDPRRMEGRRICDVDMVPVARADHPLVERADPLRQSELVRHLRVIVREQGPAIGEVPLSRGRVWFVSTVESAIAAVREGPCYGWLPRVLIADDLEKGTLKQLNTETDRLRCVSLDIMFGDIDHASSPVRYFAECLLAQRQSSTDAPN